MTTEFEVAQKAVVRYTVPKTIIFFKIAIFQVMQMSQLDVLVSERVINNIGKKFPQRLPLCFERSTFFSRKAEARREMSIKVRPNDFRMGPHLPLQ